jgi:hypothetical protein
VPHIAQLGGGSIAPNIMANATKYGVHQRYQYVLYNTMDGRFDSVIVVFGLKQCYNEGVAGRGLELP